MAELTIVECEIMSDKPLKITDGEMCGKENPCSLLLGLKTSSVILELVWRMFKKLKRELQYKHHSLTLIVFDVFMLSSP